MRRCFAAARVLMALALVVAVAGRLQAYLRQDGLSERDFAASRLLDIGDHVGVAGHLFRTKTDELSVWASSLTFLAKCYLPLPEKWHGLSDVETRYRQRYLDLAVNPEVRRVFETRSRTVAAVREFLTARGFLEVETPMMQPIAGGALGELGRRGDERHPGDCVRERGRTDVNREQQRLLERGDERIHAIVQPERDADEARSEDRRDRGQRRDRRRAQEQQVGRQQRGRDEGPHEHAEAERAAQQGQCPRPESQRHARGHERVAREAEPCSAEADEEHGCREDAERGREDHADHS